MMPYPPIEIVVGPFFVSASETTVHSQNLAPVGAAMEFATQCGSARIPLFRKICSRDPSSCEFNNLVIHPDDVPCDVQYRPFFAAETPEGVFIPIDAVLADMFRDYKINRTVADVLKDLSETVELEFPFHRTPGLLVESLEQHGFGLSWILPYGRRVNTVVCWCPPSERGKPEEGAFLVSWIDFRPRPDGTLGVGIWKEPWMESVSSELYREFRKRFRYKPVEILSAEGKMKLLSEFEWTPLSRMTAKQARAARVEFIRAHSELKNNNRNLAEAMRNAGLYANSTTVHQVMKFIPSLILESGV